MATISSILVAASIATVSCWPTISLRYSFLCNAVVNAHSRHHQELHIALQGVAEGLVEFVLGPELWLVPGLMPPLEVLVVVPGPVPVHGESLLQPGRCGRWCCVEPVGGRSRSSDQQIFSSQF